MLDTGAGPTLAFKDIGQQVVAQLLEHYLGKRGQHANVMLDTSGDTGPDAIAGIEPGSVSSVSDLVQCINCFVQVCEGCRMWIFGACTHKAASVPCRNYSW